MQRERRMTELEKRKAELQILRANLEETPNDMFVYRIICGLIEAYRHEIDLLEAEADPWKDAKRITKLWLNLPQWSESRDVACYVQHLESEIERLNGR